MRWKGSGRMNIKCIVALPESDAGAYGKSLRNFKKQWAQLKMEQPKEGYLEGVLIHVSDGCGIVRFNYGVVLKLPFEYICLQE